MTNNPVRIARGTLTAVPIIELEVEVAPVVVAAPPLRMTSQPPRFTTTTPGVMRRQPR